MYSVIILKQGLEFTEVLWDRGYQKLGRKVSQESGTWISGSQVSVRTEA